MSVDLAPRELAPFEAPGTDPERDSRKILRFDGHAPAMGRPIFAGESWIGDAKLRIDCSMQPGGYRIDVGSGGSLLVASTGGSIRCLRRQAGRDDELSRAVMGPALSLALALQDTFCLHASAVATPRGVVAFAGLSGGGKSTLAQWLAAQAGLSWSLLADDILPLRGGALRPAAQTRFPQLKLSPDEQPYLSLPEALDLRAVYVLPPPGKRRSGSRVSIDVLPSREGTVALLSHTVAARLFAPGLLSRHLAFCARVAGQIPVRRLSYPWGSEGLARIAEALQAEAEAEP